MVVSVRHSTSTSPISTISNSKLLYVWTFEEFNKSRAPSNWTWCECDPFDCFISWCRMVNESNGVRVTRDRIIQSIFAYVLPHKLLLSFWWECPCGRVHFNWSLLTLLTTFWCIWIGRSRKWKTKTLIESIKLKLNPKWERNQRERGMIDDFDPMSNDRKRNVNLDCSENAGPLKPTMFPFYFRRKMRFRFWRGKKHAACGMTLKCPLRFKSPLEWYMLIWSTDVDAFACANSSILLSSQLERVVHTKFHLIFRGKAVVAWALMFCVALPNKCRNMCSVCCPPALR